MNKLILTFFALFLSITAVAQGEPSKVKEPVGLFKKQLNAVITEYESGLSQSEHYDGSDVFSEGEIMELQIRCILAIERASGSKSIYSRQVVEISKKKTNEYARLLQLITVAKVLLLDIQNGYLNPLDQGAACPDKM